MRQEDHEAATAVVVEGERAACMSGAPSSASGPSTGPASAGSPAVQAFADDVAGEIENARAALRRHLSA